ncbi:hypothetical protein, partial [Streptomyces sp. NPDC057623]|uniref:hypothetical protein n=1 Tax=Streptomyces sp. NPDC057623 TaxID=3346187 RepID=UPI00369BB468
GPGAHGFTGSMPHLNAADFGYVGSYKVSYDGGSGYIDESTSIMSDDGLLSCDRFPECSGRGRAVGPADQVVAVGELGLVQHRRGVEGQSFTVGTTVPVLAQPARRPRACRAGESGSRV